VILLDFFLQGIQRYCISFPVFLYQVKEIPPFLEIGIRQARAGE
jgi:hypothetical protein